VATKIPQVTATRAWPWSPVIKFEDADVFALHALAAGNASAGQQQRALEFIRRAICEGERLSFMPGGEDGRRATDFAEGKRFVAVQIRRFLNMKPATVSSRGAPPAMPAVPDAPAT
jgi:hypothetical protein